MENRLEDEDGEEGRGVSRRNETNHIVVVTVGHGGNLNRVAVLKTVRSHSILDIF